MGVFWVVLNGALLLIVRSFFYWCVLSVGCGFEQVFCGSMLLFWWLWVMVGDLSVVDSFVFLVDWCCSVILCFSSWIGFVVFG